jgi:hypothetical protein
MTNNAGDRPRKPPLTDALRMLRELKVADPEERNADSIAVAVAKALLREAVEGKPAAFSEVADRDRRQSHAEDGAQRRC